MSRPPSTSIPHLMMRAGRLCALPISSVGETMRPLPLERVPGAPPFVLGVAIVRGIATPVVDLPLLLRDEAGDPRRFVIGRAGARRVALAVSEVSGVAPIDAAALDAGRALAAALAAPFIAAIVSHGVETITVIDAARVVAGLPASAGLPAHG